MNLSKSTYCLYVECPKQLWMHKNMKDKEAVRADADEKKKLGIKVGELARGLFKKYSLAEIIVNGGQDKTAMINLTRQLIAAGESIICEAAFSYGGNYCAVDILRKEGGGWVIYEVKSYNNLDDHRICYDDVAYQRYILEKCGINVVGTYIVHLNRNYMRKGALDLSRLFVIEDVLETTRKNYLRVQQNIADADVYLSQKTEPKTVFCKNCKECGFKAHCHRDVPRQSIFNLGIRYAYNYANDGVISFEDIKNSGIDFGKEVNIKLNYDTLANGTYIDKAGIRGFLSGFSYPLYFLDFESFQPAIPVFDDSYPWQQIPSQYSLHWIERDGGALNHTEFLGNGVDDPRRELAEKLCKEIPEGVITLAYHSDFEIKIIEKLAAIYPDLSGHLLSIANGIKDLEIPFKKVFYYNSAMQGKSSIKYVLPAVFPGDHSLDYSKLSGVHNGSEAMTIYPQLKDMPPAQQQKTRNKLLKYCELDTFAMVKLWQELIRVS